MLRDCHGLLYPHTRTRGTAGYGYGLCLSNPGHTRTPSRGLAGWRRVGTFELRAAGCQQTTSSIVDQRCQHPPPLPIVISDDDGQGIFHVFSVLLLLT